MLCIINLTVTTRIILMTKDKIPTDIPAVVNIPTEPADELRSDSQTQLAPEPETTPLEEWALSMINNDEPQTDPFPTETLARFGLKSSKDVITFLQSPDGKNLLAEINEEIALEKSIQEQLQLEEQEHDILVHRLQSALFLWFLEEQTYASDKVKELVLEQNKKAIADSGKTTESIAKSSPESKYMEALNKAITNYDLALKDITVKQEKNEQELTDLKQHKNELLEQGLQVEARYDKYLEHLNSLGNLDGLSDKELTDKLKDFDAKMIDHSTQIAHKLSQGDEVGARSLSDDLMSMNLCTEEVHEHLTVRQGHKYYADEHGARVHSSEHAHFILDTNAHLGHDQANKIIKKEGKCYLLKAGEDWQSVLQNPQALESAQKNFEQSKHDLMPVKKAVLHNKGLVAGAYANLVGTVDMNIKEKEADKLLLANQAGIVQANRAVLLADSKKMLNQPLSTTPTPSPRPTVTSSPAAPAAVTKPSRSTAIDPTTFYRNQIQQLRKDNPLDISLGTMMALLKRLDLGDPTRAAAIRKEMPALFQVSSQSDLRNLSRTTPIPSLMMPKLLDTLAKLGVIHAEKPSATASTKPESAALEEPEKPSPFHPTPFNKTPFG